MSKQKLVLFFLEHNYMLSPQIFNQIPDGFDYERFMTHNVSFMRSDVMVVLSTSQFQSLLPPPLTSPISPVLSYIDTKLEIIDAYEDVPKKREVKDFVGYMKARYHALKKILLQRSELQGAISISKAVSKQAREPVALIGFVYFKEQTKNGHYIIELEDTTGIVKILISQKNEELMKVMMEITLDEVIGVTGMVGSSDIIFAKELFFPDIPLKEYKKCQDDVSVCFISDLHIGSNMFAEAEFSRFMDWLNLLYGDEEQKQLAQKVRYLVISGDLIDGVGIYPGQDKELTIKDIYAQYDALAKYMGSLRPDIKVILSGGNHDALRLSEPQPKLSREYARSIYALKNVTMVTNPALVRIHGIFDILIYHGYSFDYYINNIEYLRNSGGYDASNTVMEYVLRKRHVAPTHMSSLYIPDPDRDPLVIEKVPDFFVTGHIHHDVKISSYRNVTLIGNASFQYKTAFQEKLGHTNVTWGKVVVINLKSRQTLVMDFREKIEEKKEEIYSASTIA